MADRFQRHSRVGLLQHVERGIEPPEPAEAVQPRGDVALDLVRAVQVGAPEDRQAAFEEVVGEGAGAFAVQAGEQADVALHPGGVAGDALEPVR